MFYFNNNRTFLKKARGNCKMPTDENKTNKTKILL